MNFKSSERLASNDVFTGAVMFAQKSDNSHYALAWTVIEISAELNRQIFLVNKVELSKALEAFTESNAVPF